MSRSPSEAGISPGQPEGTTERVPALEELNRMDRVWWGSDVTCVRNVTVKPGQAIEVELTFTRDSLPPIDIPERHVETVFRTLELDLRSRHALSGVQEDATVPRTVNLEQGTITMGVMNLGGRPIELPKGEGLGCFFSIGGAADYLVGARLALKAASIIKGDFGDAWQLVVPQRIPISKNLNHLPSATAVALMLDKKTRYMIPPDDTSIKLPAGEKEYRKYLIDHEILQRIGKKQTPPFFWVAQTLAKVYLPKKQGIIGVLGVMAYVNKQWICQTESRLIKPGTNWEIMHEFFDPKRAKGKSPQLEQPEEAQDPYGLGTQYVVMYLIQQPQAQPQTAISG